MRPRGYSHLFLGLITLVTLETSAASEEIHPGPGRPGLTPAEEIHPGPGRPGFTDESIVNGEEAKPGEFPWMVSLVRSSNQENMSAHFCGGSLVRPRWVVTAAHCVDEGVGASQIRVLAGTHDLHNGGERIKVDQIIIHQGWDKDSKNNDIALLKLSIAVSLNTIGVIRPEQEEELVKDETPATIAGWGHTIEGGRGSAKLQKAVVPIVNRQACNESYDGKISQNMLCAGDKAGTRDSCDEDSGGPLMIPQGNGSYLLAGIVSWGKGCARPPFYGVYTNASYYLRWITDNTL